MTDRGAPLVLFVSPVFPSPSGGGANMRAWMTLVSLASRYSVTLVVFCQNETARSSDISSAAVNLCSKVVIKTKIENGSRSLLSLSRELPFLLSKVAQAMFPRPLESAWVPKSWIREAKKELEDQQFSSMHVFKLSMALPARALACTKWSVLDIDDIESKAAIRYAKLDKGTSGRMLFLLRVLEGIKLRFFESAVSRFFSLVTVCSEMDKEEMASRIGEKVRVVPNCIDQPQQRKAFVHGRSKNVLFVGSLDYGPNQDSFRWICQEIKADVTRICGFDVSFRIVGRRPFAGAVDLAKKSGIELFTDVPDLVEHYMWADVVIVPVRSGGGTRIKILEALSFGVPVISTTLGVEGLLLDDGKEFLVADSSLEFAHGVSRVFQDAGLGRALSECGAAKVLESYSFQSSEKLIAELHQV